MSLGLVLNGGGGKGAYQIGVWKYLQKKNIRFDYISGTSAGGLNAALIATGDVKSAVALWTNLKPEAVREFDKKRIIEIVQKLAIELLEAFSLQKSSKTVKLGKEIARLIAILLKSKQIAIVFIEKGIFSIEPLKKVIRSHVDLKRFPKEPIIFLTVVKNHPIFLFGDKQYINFSSSHHAIKERLLLATSAIPIVFPNSEIGNIQYSDGGLPILGDNSPVAPLYLRDCKTIFVVHTHPKGRTNNHHYSRSEIIDIAPNETLGSFLNFEGESARRLIDLGYEDAKRIVG